MNTGVISVRYARALLKSAKAQNSQGEVYADMQSLAESYLQVPELRKAIDNPMLPQADKQKLLITACKASTPLTQQFIALVLKEGRENLIQFMANSFVALYREEMNIISGRLITSVAVSQEIEERISTMVKVRTNATIEFKTEVNPEILGGFILEYDTYRMDASVQSQLRNILKELK